MRAGVIISAISHVLLVLLALLGTPKLFDSTLSLPIEVDLVPSEQVDTPPKPEPEKKEEKAKKDAFGIEAQQGGLQPEATPPAQAQPQRANDKSRQAAPAPQQQAAATPQPEPAPG